jgi:hypothetical protein
VKVEEVGHAALSGWRKPVADAVAPRVPLRDEYVRAAVGFLFLALAVKYLVDTARAIAARRS